MNRIRFVKLTAAFCVILLEMFAFNSFYQLKQGQYYEDPSSSVATNGDVLKDSVTILRDGDAMAQSLAFDPSKTNFYPILDETRIKQNDDGSIKKTHQDDDANKKPSCGYQSCPKTEPGLINVHLVPHSHDDVGWLNTYEEYYSGSINDIHNVSVAKIIDSVVDQLQKDPSRRFIYAEMAFFQRWWNQQNEEKKSIVRDLVNSGRLEFINGGWCMNDESSTHYVDIIDQMSLGLNFLNDTFGECGRPRIAWQIDPFGHSREHAFLSAQMGFDGLFISRIDYQDKNQRMAKKNMEMIWSATNNLDIGGEIFTGVLYDHYTPPPNYCFDEKSHRHCHDEAINNGDVEKRVTEFLTYIERQANSFRTNNIMITMGHDFTYQNASTWFTPLDLLIKYANERQRGGESKFNLFYSTPSCYTKAVQEANLVMPKKGSDDFFPYGSSSTDYWTGTYTSRATLKGMIRQGSNQLQVCKQMASFLRIQDVEFEGDLSVMKEAMGTMQHHDAVTGTEKQHVADDYVRLLHKGVEECQKIQNSFYRNEVPKIPKADFNVKFCELNMSQCDVTEKSERFVVNVYNSIAKTVDKYVRFPVIKAEPRLVFQVLDPKGEEVDSELVPIPKFLLNLDGRTSDATHELVFLASQLPALGSKSYYVQSSHNSESEQELNGHKNIHVISNEKISIKIDRTTGLMKTVTVNGQTNRLRQEFLWYASSEGNMTAYLRGSGAYLFRTDSNDPYPVNDLSNKVKTIVYQGQLVQEVHQYYSKWLSQVIRLYKGQEHIELDWVVGPIPVEDGIGKEVINRFSTNLETKKVFYTDSNGRQTIKRKIDSRESFDYLPTELVAGNYYPINSHIYVKDSFKDRQLTVLVDRAQGGSSLKNGQLEVMVHRRLTHEDGIGINEILDDGSINRGTNYIIFNDLSTSPKLIRSLNQDLYKQPHISFVKTKLSYKKWSNKYNTEVKLLQKDLPINVNILTLEPRTDGKILLRLEHTFDIGEDDVLSRPATFSLQRFFNGFSIISMEEAMLGGNEWKKDSKRLVWNTEDHVTSKRSEKQFDKNMEISADWTVTLQPMQIRTFVISLKSERKL